MESGLQQENVSLVYDCLSDHELVQLCLENRRDAWEEFFSRFIPLMRYTIKNRLVAYDLRDMAEDPDIVWDIHAGIVKALVTQEKLRQCRDTTGLRAWLRTLARNHATDWVRKFRSRRGTPERIVEQSKLSLDSPAGQDEAATLADVIPAKTSLGPELEQTVETALANLGVMNNEKARWVLRLSIISHLPLSTEEIEELARFNGMDTGVLSRRMDEITNQIEIKEANKIAAEGNATLLWYEMRGLEARIHEMEMRLGDEHEDVGLLRRKMQTKTCLRDEYLDQAQMHRRPSNRDMAALVGVSEEQADQISSILKRARQTLKEMMWEE